MKLHSIFLECLAFIAAVCNTAPTWPNAIDELEDVMFLNTGYQSRGFSSHITPCSFSEFGVGRQTAAEWLRIGFHDMSTTNIYFAPYGGIDGSIAFELLDGENIGAGFNTTLFTYSGLFNSRLSIADLIALGVYASVRGCGGPVVPMRGGRIDATEAGPIGVPQPQNGQGVFINQFLRMGFNTTDMIQMTACGHTLGGVHAGDFPNIVAPGTVANDFQLFDTTTGFDNDIAVQYINGPISDPLTVGISIKNTRNSDFAVFTADKNVTLKAMTNAQTFNSMCSSILQRMIETVDPSITTLSDIIAPYEVKPSGLQLTLSPDGTQIQFSGGIRVRTTSRKVSSVQVIYTDRTNSTTGALTTTSSGTANGFDDSFAFYSFNTNLPVASSISSFTVVVAETSGLITTFTNNGAGFPVQDSVIVQTPQSCLAAGNLTILAAVRSTVTTPVNLTVTQKVARASGTPVPSLVSTTASMVQVSSLGSYTIYSASITISGATGTKYGVSSGSFADDFKDPTALGASCVPASSNSTSSSSSSVSSSTSSPSTITTITLTSTSTLATSTPTPAIKPIIGNYLYQGCYTEGTGVRALTGASFYNYPAMTLEICATNCTGFIYFGVEYGGECYCGNSLAATSTLASPSDCSFTCPGNPDEYCGAGKRLDLYKTNSTATSTAPATPTPTIQIVPSAGTYNYLGCYTEANSTRALSSASYNTNNQTIEICVAACGAKPYLYAGAEYGRECWCGNTFGAGATLVDDNQCDMSCAGNGTEYCGAGNRLSVYINNGTGTS